jgi:hypothetical protein
METKIPSHDEIRTTFASVRELIQRSQLCLDATIDDYPIGLRERGKCRLQVERNKGHGYRLVRTTTNKFGVWCKPHKSQYSDACIVVIDDYDQDHKAVWLKVDPRYGVFVQHADYTGFALVKVDFCSTPSRVERRVNWTMTKLAITRAGLHSEEAPHEEVSISPPDPPELCDAYHAWMDEYRAIRRQLEEVWANRCVQPQRSTSRSSRLSPATIAVRWAPSFSHGDHSMPKRPSRVAWDSFAPAGLRPLPWTGHARPVRPKLPRLLHLCDQP